MAHRARLPWPLLLAWAASLALPAWRGAWPADRCPSGRGGSARLPLTRTGPAIRRRIVDRSLSETVVQKMSEPLAFSPVPMERGEPEGLLGALAADLVLERGARRPACRWMAACSTTAGFVAGFRWAGSPSGRFEVMPFDNEIVVLRFRSEQIQALATRSPRTGGEPIAASVSGLRASARKTCSLAAAPWKDATIGSRRATTSRARAAAWRCCGRRRRRFHGDHDSGCPHRRTARFRGRGDAGGAGRDPRAGDEAHRGGPLGKLEVRTGDGPGEADDHAPGFLADGRGRAGLDRLGKLLEGTGGWIRDAVALADGADAGGGTLLTILHTNDVTRGSILSRGREPQRGAGGRGSQGDLDPTHPRREPDTLLLDAETRFKDAVLQSFQGRGRLPRHVRARNTTR